MIATAHNPNDPTKLLPHENGQLLASFMTKREAFAMHALAGLLADPNTTDLTKAIPCAVHSADLLLLELAK